VAGPRFWEFSTWRLKLKLAAGIAACDSKSFKRGRVQLSGYVTGP